MDKSKDKWPNAISKRTYGNEKRQYCYGNGYIRLGQRAMQARNMEMQREMMENGKELEGELEVVHDSRADNRYTNNLNILLFYDRLLT